MKASLTIIAIVGLAAGAVSAQEIRPEVKARQGQFQIMAINVGILSEMAKGSVPYDAAAAGAAAQSLVGISMVNPAPLFPAGTDNMSIDGTRAEPAIWDNLPDVIAKWQAFGEAAAAMQTAAATGPAEIGAALGTLAGTCKACHSSYRAAN
jgi:cytochrome c556